MNGRHQRRRRAWLLGLTIAPGLFLMNGCSMIESMSSSGKSPASSSNQVNANAFRPTDPMLSFLATAGEGQTREVAEPSTGVSMRVTAGRLYTAASGRQCRRYRSIPTDGPAVVDWGLACLDPQTGWMLKDMIVNPAILGDDAYRESPR